MREEMKLTAVVKMSEVQEVRARLIRAVRSLHAGGDISWPPTSTRLVEPSPLPSHPPQRRRPHPKQENRVRRYVIGFIATLGAIAFLFMFSRLGGKAGSRTTGSNRGSSGQPSAGRKKAFGSSAVKRVAQPKTSEGTSKAPVEKALENHSLVALNPPSAFFSTYIPAIRVLEGKPVPKHLRILASGLFGLEVTRMDEFTLEVHPNGGYLNFSLDVLYGGNGHRMLPDHLIKLSDVEIRVVEIFQDGRPATASFRFGVPLEDKSLSWLEWKDGTYLPFDPPPVGQTLTIPPRCSSRSWKTTNPADRLPS